MSSFRTPRDKSRLREEEVYTVRRETAWSVSNDREEVGTLFTDLAGVLMLVMAQRHTWAVYLLL